MNDTLRDPKWCDHPLVKGEFGLRFYAAAPLCTSDGQRLGTLCVMDYHPHELSPLEVKTLQSLGELVIEQLDLRLASQRLQKTEIALMQSESRFRALVEQAADGFLLHDFNGQILDVNEFACQSLGYTTVTEVREALKNERVIIFRFESDHEGEVLTESHAQECFSLLGNRYKDCCIQEALSLEKTDKVKSVADIYTSDVSLGHQELLIKLQIRAYLVTPIWHGQKMWGLLVAHQCSSARKWQVWEQELLVSLAAQLAIAIQQSELYHQLKIVNHELRDLATSDSLTGIANRRYIEKLKIIHSGSSVGHYMTCSLGIGTVMPSEKMNAKHLIEIADQGLYQAKAQGRNQYVVSALSHSIGQFV